MLIVIVQATEVARLLRTSRYSSHKTLYHSSLQIVQILQAIKDQGKIHSDSLTKLDPNSASNIQQRLGGDTAKWQYNW